MSSELDSNQNTNKKIPIWAVISAFLILFTFLILLWVGLRNASMGGMSIGQSVASFELTTFNGEVYSSEELSGKVIVLNFWASWCQPCQSEAAELEEAWLHYAASDEVIFLGVDYSDTETEARSYLEKYDITYPNGLDQGSNLSNLFHVIGVPETFIIAPDGKLADWKIGPFADTAEIISTVDAVLIESQRE